MNKAVLVLNPVLSSRNSDMVSEKWINCFDRLSFGKLEQFEIL